MNPSAVTASPLTLLPQYAATTLANGASLSYDYNSSAVTVTLPSNTSTCIFTWKAGPVKTDNIFGWFFRALVMANSPNVNCELFVNGVSQGTCYFAPGYTGAPQLLGATQFGPAKVTVELRLSSSDGASVTLNAYPITLMKT
jgi:hypothetical protein